MGTAEAPTLVAFSSAASSQRRAPARPGTDPHRPPGPSDTPRPVEPPPLTGEGREETAVAQGEVRGKQSRAESGAHLRGVRSGLRRRRRRRL